MALEVGALQQRSAINIFAFVTDAYGGYGGIAVYNRDLLSAFCQHPAMHSVVALPRVISMQMQPLPDKLTYVSKAARGLPSYVFEIVKRLGQIRKSDLIFCGHINLVPFAWLVGVVMRKPVLMGVHGIEAWQPGQRALTNTLVSKLDGYISVSEYTRNLFLRWTQIDPAKIELMPNAIHLDAFAPTGRPNAITTRYGLADKTVILTFGRLVSNERAKGFDEVLDVLPALVRDVPNLTYLIAGSGAYRSELEAKVERLGLRSHVIFTGFVPEEEKADLYRAANVYVMPSRGEGFGFVFLEAMACGTPVIASTADGSRDAVRDGELGQLVDPDDSDGLRLAILKALRLPRTIPDGLSYFSYPHFVERVNRRVDSLLKQATRR
jgi:phosphatidyl-myo-inositol dimannoside synthase